MANLGFLARWAVVEPPKHPPGSSAPGISRSFEPLDNIRLCEPNRSLTVDSQVTDRLDATPFYIWSANELTNEFYAVSVNAESFAL